MMSVAEFAVAFTTYRVSSGGSCTSWGRTRKHGLAVGGIRGDPHEYDRAGDVTYDDPEAAGTLGQRQARARAFGLELIAEGDHDHLQPIGWVNLP